MGQGQPMTHSAKEKVLAANAAFYSAFRDGNLAAMDAVWSTRDGVCVFHPNVKGIEGRTAVMRSWTVVLADGGTPDIYPVDALVILCGKTAMVICEEATATSRMIATNVFADERSGWRMVHHQATRLPVSDGNKPGTNAGKDKHEKG